MRKEALGAVVMIAFAWALWRHATNNEGLSSWEVLGVYERENTCDDKLEKTVALEASKKEYRQENPYTTSHSVERKKRYREYLCLPSNLNPHSWK